MNESDFLVEVRNSKKCPENFGHIYEEFKMFQKAAWDTLIEFHRVCEKNNIDYQLAYGSLLGVIRDKGPIPWDYDVDVILRYDKKNELLNALDKDLSSKYYYECTEKNRKCRYIIIRLAPVEYRTEALHVDVFFLIGSPENIEERRKFAQSVKKVSMQKYGKLVNVVEESVGSFRRCCSLLIKNKLPVLFIPTKCIEDKYKKLCTSFSLDTATYWISADRFADWYDFPSEIMKDTQLLKTKYGEIRVPTHYDEILKIEYGDYEALPPLEQRIQEVISNYHRITSFQRRKNG